MRHLRWALHKNIIALIKNIAHDFLPRNAANRSLADASGSAGLLPASSAADILGSSVISCLPKAPIFSSAAREAFSAFLDSFSMADNAVSNPPVFDGQDHHAVKPLEVVADYALRRGDFNAVFGDTPLHDIDDPANEGYTIFNRDHVPVHC